jgi:hypothetical protein
MLLATSLQWSIAGVRSKLEPSAGIAFEAIECSRRCKWNLTDASRLVATRRLRSTGGERCRVVEHLSLERATATRDVEVWQDRSKRKRGSRAANDATASKLQLLVTNVLEDCQENFGASVDCSWQQFVWAKLSRAGVFRLVHCTCSFATLKHQFVPYASFLVCLITKMPYT